jgi:hypothetical protein
MGRSVRIVEYFSHFLASTARKELTIIIPKEIRIEVLL